LRFLANVRTLPAEFGQAETREDFR
jgi:hypothetical protein